MNKITYLLGAGASYGERSKSGEIIKGVPIISEFEKAIKFVIDSLINIYNGPYSNNIIKEIINKIHEELRWLADKCKEYPTIDTYAKMLYVTDRKVDYERLKRILAIFLTLEQFFVPRDLRYDGFIASLIDNSGALPPIDILTWNYDVQFELAYKDYLNGPKNISYLWDNLNVINKTIETDKMNANGFSITKLNGMALFIDKDDSSLMDLFSDKYDNIASRLAVFNKISKYNNLYNNTLSYSWEHNNYFMSKIAERVKETTSLIVIGYSFPYVNRDVDREILQKMTSLRKIYIQNPNASEIKESIEATLSPMQTKNIEFVFKDKNLSQFFIPPEL
ncbi:hypothetical protein [Bacteroides caecicola]|uniref:hypothetical protein n=1 Tax=Bacteroides caecicola TaxID=1462569 RepID=UPI002011A202|nr:hypothetical protein [Bacteroides caecicola]MCL1625734.1 hypothetical protein [Bacteroides caecicola]